MTPPSPRPSPTPSKLSGYRVWLAEAAPTPRHFPRADSTPPGHPRPDVTGRRWPGPVLGPQRLRRRHHRSSAAPRRRSATPSSGSNWRRRLRRQTVRHLRARTARRAFLRRTTHDAPRAPRPPPPDHIRVGELIIDRSRRRVTLGGEPIQLTPTDIIVSALASRPDEILSRDELATLVWGYHDASQRTDHRRAHSSPARQAQLGSDSFAGHRCRTRLWLQDGTRRHRHRRQLGRLILAPRHWSRKISANAIRLRLSRAMPIAARGKALLEDILAYCVGDFISQRSLDARDRVLSSCARAKVRPASP